MRVIIFLYVCFLVFTVMVLAIPPNPPNTNVCPNGFNQIILPNFKIPVCFDDGVRTDDQWIHAIERNMTTLALCIAATSPDYPQHIIDDQPITYIIMTMRQEKMIEFCGQIAGGCAHAEGYVVIHAPSITFGDSPWDNFGVLRHEMANEYGFKYHLCDDTRVHCQEIIPDDLQPCISDAKLFFPWIPN